MTEQRRNEQQQKAGGHEDLDDREAKVLSDRMHHAHPSASLRTPDGF